MSAHDDLAAAVADLRAALVAAIQPHVRLMLWVAIALGIVLNVYLIGVLIGVVS